MVKFVLFTGFVGTEPGLVIQLKYSKNDWILKTVMKQFEELYLVPKQYMLEEII